MIVVWSILAGADRMELENGMELRLLSALEVLEARREAEELYRAFGRAWAKFPEEWRLFLLSSHTEFERTFGKQADKKRKLYNGMLKCQLYMYFK